MHMDTQLVTLIFTIVTGCGVLLQACVLLGMFLALRKTQTKVHELAESVEDHVLPVLSSSRVLLEDISPKLKIITANMVDATGTLRSQAEQVKNVVDDITTRTRQQTARVDGMLTGALNSVADASAALERGVAGPLRQVSGVLSGLRAGLETLRAKVPTAPVRSTAPRPPAPSPVTPSPVTSVPVASAPVTSAPVASASPVVISPSAITPEEASAAAARFVRDRAAASSGDRH